MFSYVDNIWKGLFLLSHLFMNNWWKETISKIWLGGKYLNHLLSSPISVVQIISFVHHPHQLHVTQNNVILFICC